MRNPPRTTPNGKPAMRVLARLSSHDLTAATEHFPTREMKAYYFANAIEAPACWPRVLDGRMKQDRFHERTDRMMRAILAVTA